MRKPRKVYKYFDFAPDNSELKKRECNGSLECLSIDRANSIKALRGRYVWASKPTSFNDPFDCLKRFSSNLTRENFIRLYHAKGRSKAEILAMAKAFFGVNSTLTALGREHVQCMIEKAYEQCSNHGVVCFSKDPLSELMWGHYAASHTGFCLEFTTTQPHAWSRLLRKVNYSRSNRLPNIEFKDLVDEEAGSERVNQLILSKSRLWAYEKEWRIVLERGNEKLDYKEESLTGVIFGMNISDENRRMLESLAPITTFRKHYVCERSESFYKFKLVEVR